MTVAPPGQSEVEILLQEPDPRLHGEAGAERLGELIGRTPTWSVHTDDCEATVEELRSAGVPSVHGPAARPSGLEAVLEDLSGNRFSLLEPTG